MHGIVVTTLSKLGEEKEETRKKKKSEIGISFNRMLVCGVAS